MVRTDSYKHTGDQQLLEKYYASHDQQWLGILLERYTLLLLGVCMKYLKNEEEARDAVQQVFLKAITEMQKYKVEYFKSWIYMVAKNHCLMKLRDRQGKTMVEVHENNLQNEEADNGEDLLWKTDKAIDLVAVTLQELNHEQRQCVTLFYLQKKSYQEISDSTGYTMMQVKSYIQNGKRNLKIMIEKKLKEDDDINKKQL